MPQQIEEGDDRFVSRRELEHRLIALRELLDQRELGHTRALELQAREYMRRMDELNHAHTQAQENWARSLPRETFANFTDQWDKWRTTVNDQLAQFQGGLTVFRFLALSGVLAFFLELLRLIGVTK